MTPHQYWDEDSHLAKDFRDAYKLKERRKNWDAWWEGRYVYEAVSSAVSALFTKNKSDIYPYPSEPYPITKQEQRDKERRDYEAKRERMIASFKGKAKITEGGQTNE